MRIPFAQVDAFASAPFAGNPAAVMVLPHWLDDATLQRIAAEANQPATAFLVAAGDAFEIRWFGPARELLLCGHGSLAAGHFLLASDPHRTTAAFFAPTPGREIAVTRAGGGYELALPLLPTEPRPLPDLLAAFGLANAVETRWRDDRYALIVLPDEAAVRAVTLSGDIGQTQVTLTAPGARTEIVSRVFYGGGMEDQVTGSSHAVSAGYWAQRLGRDRYSAHQASARGGDLRVRVAGDQVVLGGECVTVVEGTFLLD